MKTVNCLERLEALSPSETDTLNSVSLVYFAQETVTLENGVKFSFDDHPYLFELYDLHHDNIVIEKAAQMGITSWAFIRSVWACKYLFPLGVIYFFPTKSDVSDFTRGRINPFLIYNRHIKIVDDNEVDNVGIKRIGNAFLYLRGMKSTVGMKSVPADCIVYDEVDEAPQIAKEIADKRISHSDFKWKMELSNPTIENYGIDKSFQSSDMRYWYLKCEHCGEWNCLEKEFPNCLTRTNGSVIRACKKCRQVIDINSKGEWIPDYPTRTDKRGYHISQLYSKYISPKTLLDEFENPHTNLENFWRLRMGNAYTSRENKLDKQQILNLERAEMTVGLNDYCYGGVDQGNDLNIVILKILPNDKIGLMELLKFKNFEDIDLLIRQYRIQRLVIDALPEQREARKLRMRNPNIVYLNFYNAHQKGSYNWNDEKGIVEENRTESLDASTKLISDKKLVINNKIDRANIETFAEHCSNIARIKEEDEETGSQRYVWAKTGADHFRHGLNYAYIAMNPYIESDVGDVWEEKYEEERDLI